MVRHHSLPLVLMLVAVVGLGLRLFLAATFYGNFDQQSYEIVAEIMRHGDNLYAETTRYNYAPPWAVVLLGLSFVADGTHLPFHLIVRSFLSLIDGGNALLVGLIAARRGYAGTRSAIAYWLNPIPILIVGFQGQFDTLALLPVLAAVWLVIRTPHRPPVWRIWLLCTGALLIKHLIVFQVWTLLLTLLPRRRAMLAFGAAMLVWLLSFSPFLPAGAEGILANVLAYNGWIGVYGIGTLFPWPVAPAVFYGSMLVLPMLWDDHGWFAPWERMEGSAVALLVFLHGIAPQYLLIPVLFGAVRRSHWFWWYTGAASLVLMSRPEFPWLPIPQLWGAVWIIVVGWLLSPIIVWRLPAQARQPRPRIGSQVAAPMSSATTLTPEHSTAPSQEGMTCS